MRVYVNGEERHLHVYDRASGCDYAKNVLCSQERLDTDEYGAFTLTEEDYKKWQGLLAVQQESEDILFALKDCVDAEEMKNYLYEETMYLVHIQETTDMENLCLKELRQALAERDMKWLTDNGFVKTAEKLS
ncbi:MAG: hypothetical protein LKF74_01825 [Megasphaera sp.]|jgi:hypothetical protein|nr:hypothetical protein [Megasphaera sp.]MCH4187316.1 hypothetical protein [Megasphaera sp.]MCH4217282.1 hypothetical protein [Megasphaera sp.]